MGRVFLGVSPGGRKVAIKVVHWQLARDPEFRRRFAREVEAARRVGGFHTALVVDADPDADLPWMATAFVAGPSLSVAVAEGGPLGEAGVRGLGVALAEGLAAIHSCGLVHRDLKPSNVIVADDGPRIIDFGIAKGTGGTSLTGSHVLIGTLRYMSPEQLGGGEATAASDVFALGAVLAYAATGHDPFGAPDLAVIAQILHDPPDLEPLAGDLRAIIAGCLAKDPAARPSTTDLLTRLRSPHLPGEPGGQPPLRSQPPTRRRSSRRRWRTAAVAAVATAAVALATVLAVVLPGTHPAASDPAATHPAATHPAISHPASANSASSRSLGSHPASAKLAATLVATIADPSPPDPATGVTEVSSVAFGPGGILAIGDGTNHIYLGDTATGHVARTLTDPSHNGFDSEAFGPGGIFAAGDNGGNVYLWNTATWRLTVTLTVPPVDNLTSWVDAVAFAPDGTLAVGAGRGFDTSAGSVSYYRTYLWDTATRRITATFTPPGFGGLTDTEINSVAFGPGGVLAIGVDSNTTFLWNTATRRITATLTLTNPPGGGIGCPAVFGPGSALATCDSQEDAYLWDTATRHKIALLATPLTGQGANNVAFGPGGILAVGDGNGSTYLWDTATQRIAATLPDPSGQSVDAVAFGPGGMFATGDANGNAYLWTITYPRS